MNDERVGNWMYTYSGVVYYPLDPRPEEIRIADIAHHLSMLCRYAGACSRYYSVAEHSVHVSHMVPEELALEALLHDASEAYCCDIVRPLKVALPDYQRIEELNDMAVRIRFKLPPYEHPLVKQADNDILCNEYRALLPPMPTHVPWSWPGEYRPEVAIRGWGPPDAEIKFLERFRELIRVP